MGTNSQIETINVVEICDGNIGLTAFPNNENGKRDAKILFYDLVYQDDSLLLDEDIEEIVTKRKYKSGKTNYSIQMVYSEDL